jgi:hypothetical protein
MGGGRKPGQSASPRGPGASRLPDHSLEVNRQPVPDSYGAIVMAELAQLREFPAVRVEVHYSCTRRPEPAAMARMIADELARNEIWD